MATVFYPNDVEEAYPSTSRKRKAKVINARSAKVTMSGDLKRDVKNLHSRVWHKVMKECMEKRGMSKEAAKAEAKSAAAKATLELKASRA